MREIVGDLFAHNERGPSAICIPTNGYVNGRGQNVMGGGVAGQAKHRFPGIDELLGALLRTYGNMPLVIFDPRRHAVPYYVVSFPTKPSIQKNEKKVLPQYRGRFCFSGKCSKWWPGWMSQSLLDQIEVSASLLVRMADYVGWESVVLPRPGCGLGGLHWDEVRPRLSNILDDRFYVIRPEKEK